MATPRFFVPDATAAAGATVVLPAAAAHHARRVLRLRAGDALVLFDGRGNECQATLLQETQDPAHVQARIISGGPVDREAQVHITLIQALCAQDKIDWLLEKCVELGVARLVLAPAARSVVRLDDARGARRLERWRDIALSACAQCGRNRLLELELAPGLDEALRRGQDAAARWLLDPDAAAGLTAAPGAPARPRVSCAVGPEGGFTDAERACARALGYAPARLGPRVLRTETAGLAAVAALLALHGEYR